MKNKFELSSEERKHEIFKKLQLSKNELKAIHGGDPGRLNTFPTGGR